MILSRGEAAGERAEEILGRMLKHATSDIRLEALAQLRPVGDRMVDDLRSLGENDPDPRVRAAVREVLDEIENRPEK